MTRARYLAYLLGALFLGVLVLAGCDVEPQKDPPSPSNSNGVSQIVNTVNLPDGRKLLCTFESTNSYNGGPSCDWEHSK